jgi:hypothetical protein
VISRKANSGKVFTMPVFVFENPVNQEIKLDPEIKMSHQDLRGI